MLPPKLIHIDRREKSAIITLYVKICKKALHFPTDAHHRQLIYHILYTFNYFY